MSLSDNLNDISEAFANIEDALDEKGATPPVGDITSYAHAIETIASEGGINPSGTYNITSNGTVDITTYKNVDVNVTVESTLDELTVTPTTSSQEITPTEPYNGFSSVNVEAVTSSIDSNIQAGNIKDGVSILGVTGNVVELVGETKNVTPTTSSQTILPSEGKNAITEVSVDAVTSAIDNNITAGNIKKDVTILGVTGSYEGSGGGGETPLQDEVYEVRVVDYDGTILDSAFVAKNNTYQLPTAPSHNQFVFQGWCAPRTITNNAITVDTDMMITPVYDTASGLSEFDIKLEEDITSLQVTLNMDGTKNWGDGTSDTSTSHEYADYGEYTITCNGTTISGALFGNSSTSTYQHFVKAIRFSGVSTLPQYAVMNQSRLEYVTMDNTVQTVNDYCFSLCAKLKYVLLSNNISSFGEACFFNLLNLEATSIPNTVASVQQNFMYINEGNTKFDVFGIPDSITSLPTGSITRMPLKRLVIPSNITSVANNSFCYLKKCQIIENRMPSNATIVGDIFNYISGKISVAFTTNFPYSNTFGYCENAEITFTQTTISPRSGGYIGYANKNCKYKFPNLTTVPTFATNAFYDINKGNNEIYVNSSVYSDWVSRYPATKPYTQPPQPTTYSFQVTPNTGVSDIYIDGEKINGTYSSRTAANYLSTYTAQGDNSINYDGLIFKPATKCVVTKDTASVNPGGTRNVVLDYTDYVTDPDLNYHKVSTTVSGLDTSMYIDNKQINAFSNCNIYTNSVNVPVKLQVNGHGMFSNITLTKNSTGSSDVSFNPTINYIKENQWVQPVLSSDGTPGTSQYALRLDAGTVSSGNLYDMMDGDDVNTMVSITPIEDQQTMTYYALVTFYSQTAFNPSSVVFVGGPDPYDPMYNQMINCYMVNGSNDGITWEPLTVNAHMGDNGIDISTTSQYNYLQFQFDSYSYNPSDPMNPILGAPIDIREMTISGTYKTTVQPNAVHFDVANTYPDVLFVKTASNNNEWYQNDVTYVNTIDTTIDYTYGVDYNYTHGTVADTSTDTIPLTNNNMHTLTLSAGVSGLKAEVKYNSLWLPMRDNGDGTYSCGFQDSLSSTVNFEYRINGENYLEATGSGSSTPQNHNLTLSITLTPATYVAFTRPNLASNGTIGGSAFAVKSNTNSSSCYKAVDGNNSTNYTMSSSETYTIYNPNPLKVTNMSYTYSSSSGGVVKVYGSNDNSDYVLIGTGTYANISITSDKAYKYLMFTVGSTARIVEITINAKEKVASGQ